MSFFDMHDMFGDKEVDKELFRKRSEHEKFEEEVKKTRQENANFCNTSYMWCKLTDQRVHFKVCDKKRTEELCDCDARLAFDLRNKKNEENL